MEDLTRIYQEYGQARYEIIKENFPEANLEQIETTLYQWRHVSIRQLEGRPNWENNLIRLLGNYFNVKV